MPSHENGTEIIYHGRRENGDTIITVETAGGQHIGMLPHIARHSPSGMNWGYRGSGPCDTALSLLLAALGDDAICPLCQGSGRVVYTGDGEDTRIEPYDPSHHPWTRRGWSCTCDAGFRKVPYMQFTDIVAGWGNEWTITHSRILAWLQEARNTADV